MLALGAQLRIREEKQTELLEVNKHKVFRFNLQPEPSSAVSGDLMGAKTSTESSRFISSNNAIRKGQSKYCELVPVIGGAKGLESVKSSGVDVSGELILSPRGRLRERFASGKFGGKSMSSKSVLATSRSLFSDISRDQDEELAGKVEEIQAVMVSASVRPLILAVATVHPLELQRKIDLIRRYCCAAGQLIQPPHDLFMFLFLLTFCFIHCHYSNTESDRNGFLKNYKPPLVQSPYCCQKHEHGLVAHHSKVLHISHE